MTLESVEIDRVANETIDIFNMMSKASKPIVLAIDTIDIFNMTFEASKTNISAIETNDIFF